MIDGLEFLKELGKKLPAPLQQGAAPCAPGAAYRFALRSLSAAGASKKRLKERMKRKGFEGEEADEAIAELERLGFINDAAMAEQIVEKCASAMEGEALIRLRLQRAGIEEGEAFRAIKKAGPLLEEGREKFIALLEKECGQDRQKAAKLCRKKGQPLGLAFRAGASCTPGSVAP